MVRRYAINHVPIIAPCFSVISVKKPEKGMGGEVEFPIIKRERKGDYTFYTLPCGRVVSATPHYMRTVSTLPTSDCINCPYAKGIIHQTFYAYGKKIAKNMLRMFFGVEKYHKAENWEKAKKFEEGLIQLLFKINPPISWRELIAWGKKNV